MSESEVFKWLEFDEYRIIVECCGTTPKTAKEIAQLTKVSITNTGGNLETLERHKAVVHTEEGWKATSIGIKVLNKYFR